MLLKIDIEVAKPESGVVVCGEGCFEKVELLKEEWRLLLRVIEEVDDVFSSDLLKEVSGTIAV